MAEPATDLTLDSAALLASEEHEVSIVGRSPWYLAWRRLRRNYVALGFFALFVVIKGIEYHEKIAAGLTPSTNEFFMYYFVLTGLHLAHVVIGLIVLTVLSRLARKRAPTRTHIAFFEGGACFWHMVDLLWLIIFPLIFLVH